MCVGVTCQSVMVAGSIRQSDGLLAAQIDEVTIALDLVAELGKDGVAAARGLVQLEGNALAGPERLGELGDQARLLARGRDFQGSQWRGTRVRHLDLSRRLG